jgi:hypothetical protein
MFLNKKYLKKQYIHITKRVPNQAISQSGSSQKTKPTPKRKSSGTTRVMDP